jgi:hypothetical protein
MDKDWSEPKGTGNSQLLLGFLAGSLRDCDYRAVEAYPAEDRIIIENSRTGNRFEMTIKQCGGEV